VPGKVLSFVVKKPTGMSDLDNDPEREGGTRTIGK